MNTIAQERRAFFERYQNLERHNFLTFSERSENSQISFQNAEEFSEAYAQSNACWQKTTAFSGGIFAAAGILTLIPLGWRKAYTFASRFFTPQTIVRLNQFGTFFILPIALTLFGITVQASRKPEGKEFSFLKHIFPEVYQTRKAAAEDAFNLQDRSFRYKTLYNNDMINPHPTSKYQQVQGLYNRDYKNYSFLSRINDSQKQAAANGFGYSLFDMNDHTFRDHKQIFAYLKQNTDHNGPLEILQWSMHGDEYGRAIYDRVRALVGAGILARGSMLIMDQCQNADVTNEKQAMCRKAAKDFGIHIYASDTDEFAGEGFTDGMMYFNPDGSPPIYQKPPVK